MEAVVLSIYLTNGVPCLGRFPINFKSELPARAGVSQKYFYHVVLGLAHGNRFGAIGLRFTIDILYFTSKLPTTVHIFLNPFIDTHMIVLVADFAK